MSGRRSNSLFSLGGLLKFLGIGSPAVLLMAALSYFGFRTPMEGQPAETQVEAKRLVEVIETVREKFKGPASEGPSTNVVQAQALFPAKDSGHKPKERQDWFEPPPGSVVHLSSAQPKPAPPAVQQKKVRKDKTKRNTVPDFNPY